MGSPRSIEGREPVQPAGLEFCLESFDPAGAFDVRRNVERTLEPGRKEIVAQSCHPPRICRQARRRLRDLSAFGFPYSIAKTRES